MTTKHIARHSKIIFVSEFNTLVHHEDGEYRLVAGDEYEATVTMKLHGQDGVELHVQLSDGGSTSCYGSNVVKVVA